MRRRVVQVVVIFLNILAVIAFFAGQAEKPLFQDRISLVPQGKSKTNELATIGDAGDAVFIPAVSTGTRVLVRKEIPCIAVGAVIFAHGTPCAFAQIWSPALPMLGPAARFRQPLFFVGHTKDACRCYSLFNPSRAATLYASARVG